MQKTSLVPVFNGTISGTQSLLCNARDLHKVLKVGRDFSSWIKGRINEYNFVEGEDYSLILANRSDCSPDLGSKKRGGHNRIEYHLTIGMGKELSMLENNEQGRIARRYFIECERRMLAQLESRANPVISDKDAQIMNLSALCGSMIMAREKAQVLYEAMEKLRSPIVSDIYLLLMDGAYAAKATLKAYKDEIQEVDSRCKFMRPESPSARQLAMM